MSLSLADLELSISFSDPDVLEPASISQLKELKPFIKLSTKMEKDLETLRKKMNKVLGHVIHLFDIIYSSILLVRKYILLI